MHMLEIEPGSKYKPASTKFYSSTDEPSNCCTDYDGSSM